MELIAKADVVLCLGTRLNPFSTLPGYGIDYWPTDAKIIQVDLNPDRIGLTKKVTVGIVGDAAKVATAFSPNWPTMLAMQGARAQSEHRADQIRLGSRTDIDDRRAGRSGHRLERTRTCSQAGLDGAPYGMARDPGSLATEAIISSDIGNNCAIGNAYPSFNDSRKYLAPGLFGPCGYGLPSIVGAKIGQRDVPVVGFAGDGAFGISVNELTAIGRGEWPAITQIVFRNYQWGAEKRNSHCGSTTTLLAQSWTTGVLRWYRATHVA